jgi:hypothetical protein
LPRIPLVRLGDADRWCWIGRATARGSARGRQGFNDRPFPAGSWRSLLSLPVSKTTWPYSDREAEVIVAMLPEEFRERALGMAVRAAQLFVFHQTQVNRGKANARKEIEQLRRALVCLFDALKQLSPVARDYLRTKMRPLRLPDQEPFSTESLRYAIDRFDHENRLGLENPPPPIRGGPRARNHEARLYQRLQDAFAIAHGGKMPPRGWPKFLRACVTPLKDFGLSTRSDKTWQDILRKRRKNRPEKRGVIPGD